MKAEQGLEGQPSQHHRTSWGASGFTGQTAQHSLHAWGVSRAEETLPNTASWAGLERREVIGPLGPCLPGRGTHSVTFTLGGCSLHPIGLSAPVIMFFRVRGHLSMPCLSVYLCSSCMWLRGGRQCRSDEGASGQRWGLQQSGHAA